MECSPSRRLIVLFGHKNTAHGKLSDIAEARCELAKGGADTYPEAVLLPTGSFGPSFNTATEPHHKFLSRRLEGLGISSGRILLGGNSTNTIEDCLYARAVAIQSGVSEIILVTSDYHMPRVRFAATQLLCDWKLVFMQAATPETAENKSEANLEKGKLKRLRREWITPPLLSSSLKFPEKLYEMASTEHRHYDTLSLSVVTAMIVVSGYILLSIPAAFSNKEKAFSYIGGLFLNVAFILIYERMVQAARIARRTLRLIEVGFGERGFSSNYSPDILFSKWQPSIRLSVLFIFGVLSLSQLGALLVCLRGVFNLG